MVLALSSLSCCSGILSYYIDRVVIYYQIETIMSCTIVLRLYLIVVLSLMTEDLMIVRVSQVTKDMSGGIR